MRIVVVSPHLDDAVLSVGGIIQRLTEAGRQVEVLTVFAGDPELRSPPSYWDSGRGYQTASEATSARRDEDRRATRRLGAEARWLPFDDCDYTALRDPEAIWSAMSPSLASADAVLVPGYPMVQYDHRWVASLVVQRVSRPNVVLYAEMPYSAQPFVLAKALVRGRSSPRLRYLTEGQPLVWRKSRLDRATMMAKRDAVECYGGELKALGVRGAIASVSDRLFRREHLAICRPHDTLHELLEPALDG